MRKTTKTKDPFVIHARSIINKSYARRLVPEQDGGYSASIQEFPGCFAEGESAEEALQRLDDAAESWVAVHLANGNSVREPIEFHGASGKIALRIPRGLHQQVCELAESEDCSINQLLNVAIAEYVSRTQVVRQIKQTIDHAINSLHSFMPVPVVAHQWETTSLHHVETIQIGSEPQFKPFSFSPAELSYSKA